MAPEKPGRMATLHLRGIQKAPEVTLTSTDDFFTSTFDLPILSVFRQ
jgi:hypothetical protein